MVLNGNVAIRHESKQSCLCFDKCELHNAGSKPTPLAVSPIFAALELSVLHIILPRVVQLHQQVALAY